MSVRDPRPLRKFDDNYCFVCSPRNPAGLHVTFTIDGDVATATFVPQAEHVGWSGIVHGGIVLTLLDEAMAYAVYAQGVPGITARMETRFRRPAAPGDALHVEGVVVDSRRNLMDVRAVVRLPDGSVVAEASARFVVQRPHDHGAEID